MRKITKKAKRVKLIWEEYTYNSYKREIRFKYWDKEREIMTPLFPYLEMHWR